MGDLRGVESAADAYAEGRVFKENSIARLRVAGFFAGVRNCTVETHNDLTAVCLHDLPENHTVVIAKGAVHQLLVVIAIEPAGVKASAEQHFQGFHVFFVERNPVQGFAVGTGNGSHVFGALEAAFDFEGIHADFFELGELGQRAQVAGTE